MKTVRFYPVSLLASRKSPGNWLDFSMISASSMRFQVGAGGSFLECQGRCG
jgi:hypothetical protein